MLKCTFSIHRDGASAHVYLCICTQITFAYAMQIVNHWIILSIWLGNILAGLATCHHHHILLHYIL